MSIWKLIKEHRIISIFSFGFFAWIIVLLILEILNQRQVVFLDALDSYQGTNVSSEYISELPLIRYLIEPFAGVAFILDYDFEWMIAFTLLYVSYRIIYLILKRANKIHTETFKSIKYPIYRFMSFVFKVFSLAVLVIAISVLIGFISLGYFFVNRYFNVIVQVGIRISVALVFFKILHFILIILHPKLKFSDENKRPRRSSKKRSRVFTYSVKLKTEIVYMVATLYLLVGANILLISTPFPTHSIKTTLDPDEFLFDFHIHTTMSDGWISPEQRVNYYLDHGISGAAFTDHDNIRGALLAQEYVENNNLNFTVWVGEEWTDNEKDIHMNYYGVNEEVVAPLSKTPSGIPLALNASDMIDYIKDKGGYVIVNHYNYDPNPQGGFGVPYTLEQLSGWGVDGFEIVNGDHIEATGIRNFCLNNTNRYNESLICIGGSDIHTNEDLNAFVRIKLNNPSNKSIDNIFRNLRNNTHSVITINMRSDEVDFPGELNDLGFDIFERFLNYLLNINSHQALSWIIWSGIMYGAIISLYKTIKKRILPNQKTIPSNN
jgi:hypothetical protein